MSDNKTTKQTLITMPDDVMAVLKYKHLLGKYTARPEYQRKEYLEWFTDAEHEQVRLQRIRQMLAELEAGDTFMGNDHVATKH